MNLFPAHTPDSAPAAARPLLESIAKSLGVVPNLHAIMAESPEVLEAYQALNKLFTRSSLSAVERNVVWLTINVEHQCHYCVPAHTAIAKMQGVDDAVVEALRRGEPLKTPRLEALRVFTLQLVRKRGEVDETEVAAFLDAGFTPRNILEVILGVSHKVMSNYLNKISQTPVDPQFAAFAWSPPAQEAAA